MLLILTKFGTLRTYNIIFNLVNNLRLVQDKNNYCPELFCYSEDRAKIDHTPRDFESVSKNDLRYL